MSDTATAVVAGPVVRCRARPHVLLAGLTTALGLAVILSLMVDTEPVAPGPPAGGADRRGRPRGRVAAARLPGATHGRGRRLRCSTRLGRDSDAGVPLADPGILVVNSDGALGVTLAMAASLPFSVAPLVVSTLLGAGVATIAVLHDINHAAHTSLPAHRVPGRPSAGVPLPATRSPIRSERIHHEA